MSDGGSLGYREYLEDQVRTGGRAGYERASVVPHICLGAEAATWHHGSWLVMPDALLAVEISRGAKCMNHIHPAEEEETGRGRCRRDIRLVEERTLGVVENAASLCIDHLPASADCETFGEKQANGCADEGFCRLECRYRRQVGRVGMVSVLNGSCRYGDQLGSGGAALQGGRCWSIYHL